MNNCTGFIQDRIFLDSQWLVWFVLWIQEKNNLDNSPTVLVVAEQHSVKGCLAPGAALPARYVGVHKELGRNTASKADSGQKNIRSHDEQQKWVELARVCGDTAWEMSGCQQAVGEKLHCTSLALFTVVFCLTPSLFFPIKLSLT